MLTDEKIERFRQTGHLTIENVFSREEMTEAISDAMTWHASTVASMSEEERQRCLEFDLPNSPPRKLENPFVHRVLFRKLAFDARLIGLVECLIGAPRRVLYSQIFFKAPRGTAKPMHQDSYYFRPNDENRFLTAWLSLDGADEGNGCMMYADGSHLNQIYEHFPLPGKPHHLHVRGSIVKRFKKVSAPVASGGVSFHHGRTIHGSIQNRSSVRWRRACTLHFSSE